MKSKELLENQNARRDSLAQEIAETLQVRGFHVPDWRNSSASDLIGAIARALDEAYQRGRNSK